MIWFIIGFVTGYVVRQIVQMFWNKKMIDEIDKTLNKM